MAIVYEWSDRQTRSKTCCDPTVVTISSGSASIPRLRSRAAIFLRRGRKPCGSAKFEMPGILRTDLRQAVICFFGRRSGSIKTELKVTDPAWPRGDELTRMRGLKMGSGTFFLLPVFR